MNWKWVGVIVLYVIGLLALIAGILWLVEPIHSLPAFLGGKHGHGHYRRRGEAMIVVAVVVTAIAVYLTVRFRRQDAGAAGGERSTAGSGSASPTSSDSLLAAPTAPTTASVEASEAPVENS